VRAWNRARTRKRGGRGLQDFQDVRAE